jgi:hypothetical protein
MVNSGLSTSSTLNPTRQQLDELDTLIQQMLGLPANHLNEGLASRTPTTTTFVPSAAEVAPLAGDRQNDPSIGDAQSNRGSLSYLITPAAMATAACAVDRLAEPLIADATPILGIQTAPSTAPIKPPARLPKPTSNPRTSVWLLPLVGVNLLFDCVTVLVGPVGRWLRGDWGRSFLGWVGLALLAAAMAWGLVEAMVGRW